MRESLQTLLIVVGGILMAFLRELIKRGVGVLGSRENTLRFRYWLRNHEKRIKRAINQKHSFYQSLTPEAQKEFLFRVYYFLNTTRFFIHFPANVQKVKMTISFVAAQISYKLPIQSFDLYHKVVVHEDDYYSPLTQQYHKGEVNPGAGVMAFSWKAIAFGLSQNDGLNLLLHEFAHALRLEHKLMNYPIFDEAHFNNMEALLHEEFENMASAENHLFRAYASTNIEEFFAVASEVFFERSSQMQMYLPELHAGFKRLYKQQPIT